MKIEKYRSVTSTNDVAKKLAKEGANEWTVVLANEQTAGRGRRGRAWYSPADHGLWLSIILQPNIPLIDASKLGLVMSLGIATFLGNMLGLKATVKWPNDILIDNRKVCGILLETITSGGKLSALIAGIGLNVNQEQFPKEIESIATSLRLELGQFIPRETILDKLLKELKREYENFKAGRFHHQLRQWRKLCPMLKQPVTIQTAKGSISGVATDVGEDGSLILTTEDGEQIRFFAGDITFGVRNSER